MKTWFDNGSTDPSILYSGFFSEIKYFVNHQRIIATDEELRWSFIWYGMVILTHVQQNQLLNLHFHLACILFFGLRFFRYSPLCDRGDFLIDGSGIALFAIVATS